MTTTVTIEAHCSSDTEVHVCPTDMKDLHSIPETILQDGEKLVVYVYDNNAVAVFEMKKSMNA